MSWDVLDVLLGTPFPQKEEEGEIIDVSKKYKCKVCRRLISGKYVLFHLRRHNIDVGSWKKHKLAPYVESLNRI